MSTGVEELPLNETLLRQKGAAVDEVAESSACCTGKETVVVMK